MGRVPSELKSHMNSANPLTSLCKLSQIKMVSFLGMASSLSVLFSGTLCDLLPGHQFTGVGVSSRCLGSKGQTF